MIKCNHWIKSTKFFRGRCELGKHNGRPSFGECVDHCGLCKNDRNWLDNYIDNLPKTEAPEQKEKREKQQAEIIAAVAQLPSDFQRLVKLDKWMKDIGVPFEQVTGQLFNRRPHKLERDDKCRTCPHMIKEKAGTDQATMACGKCDCRVGKLVADPNEPDPHEIAGKIKLLGNKGKTADAVRIQSSSWYFAKQCGNANDGGQDYWREIDEKNMTPEQLKIRDELYAA